MVKVEGRFAYHKDLLDADGNRQWSDWMDVAEGQDKELLVLLVPAGKGATIERVSYHSDGTEDTRIQWRLKEDA